MLESIFLFPKKKTYLIEVYIYFHHFDNRFASTNNKSIERLSSWLRLNLDLDLALGMQHFLLEGFFYVF